MILKWIVEKWWKIVMRRIKTKEKKGRRNCATQCTCRYVDDTSKHSVWTLSIILSIFQCLNSVRSHYFHNEYEICTRSTRSWSNAMVIVVRTSPFWCISERQLTTTNDNMQRERAASMRKIAIRTCHIWMIPSRYHFFPDALVDDKIITEGILFYF